MYDPDKATKELDGGDKGHMKNQVPYGSLFFFDVRMTPWSYEEPGA